jgi:general secretion pathway protein G
LKDGWGTLYQYASPGNHNVHGFDLWSLGADAAPGGEDLDADLGNWDAEQPVDQ